jgi:hypothetical protein
MSIIIYSILYIRKAYNPTYLCCKVLMINDLKARRVCSQPYTPRKTLHTKLEGVYTM